MHMYLYVLYLLKWLFCLFIFADTVPHLLCMIIVFLEFLLIIALNIELYYFVYRNSLFPLLRQDVCR